MGSCTIYDIAAEAGVSHTAVSLALRPFQGCSRMRSITRERIQRAAKRLNYRAHPLAKGLRLGRTCNIGFYINHADHLNLSIVNWHRVIVAMQSRLWEREHRLGFYYFEPEHREGFEEFLTPGRVVDALVVQGRTLKPKEIEEIRTSGIRAVSLYEKLEGFCSLVVDEFAAGRAAAQFLHECGHRRAAVIANRNNVERWEGRIRGFLQRAKELGIEVPESSQYYSQESNSTGQQRLLARELFARYRRSASGIACLYVPSDYYAFPVVEAIDESGLVLGKDISVLSYDDLEGGGCMPWKERRLTTFRVPYEAIGKQAADILTQPDHTDWDRQFLFAPKLVIRNSVARIGG